MKEQRRRDTAPEVAIRRSLHAVGFRFRVNFRLAGSRRSVDIALTRPRVAVFVDGCFWHGCPIHGTWPKANARFWREKIEANRRRDQDTDRRLTEAGWHVIRIWEHEDFDGAAKRIARVVRQRTPKSANTTAARKSKSR